jgi:hypothetical protein
MMAMGSLSLTATAIARAENIERVLSEEMAEQLREHRGVANLKRPDGQGGVLFVGPRFQN